MSWSDINNVLQAPLKDIVGNPIDQVRNSVDSQIDQWNQQLMNHMTNLTLNIADKILAIGAIGAVIILVYYCIRYMFLSKPEDSQYIIFTTFIILLLRIFNVLLKGGIS